jgi:hypothetical protein
MGYLDSSSDDDNNSSGYNNNPLGRGLGSILRLAGTNIPARAQYIGESIVSGTLFSISVGMSCGAIGAAVFPLSIGPVIPYIIGSSIGYCYGVWDYYRTTRTSAIRVAKYYPTIFAYSLWTNYHIIVPKSVLNASTEQLLKQQRQDVEEGKEEDVDNDENQIKFDTAGTLSVLTNNKNNTAALPLDQWILQGGLGRLHWSMLASLSCRRDIITIETQKRQHIVESIINQQHQLLSIKDDENDDDDDDK